MIDQLGMQLSLPFATMRLRSPKPFRLQLLKWIGNKQRFADEIVANFPSTFKTYYEPFLGSGAVLGTLAPRSAVAADIFPPLVDIWRTLKDEPETLKKWYSDRCGRIAGESKAVVYEQVRAAYNAAPGPADLLYLCRSCYGGVVRFRKADGHMSTPCGVHNPVDANSFSRRVDAWQKKVQGTRFVCEDFAVSMARAKSGDLIYCDPPYVDSQSILYGAQAFSIERLLDSIVACKSRGVRVALSIDGTKRSGDRVCDVPVPVGLFETEVLVNCGRSMLRRFQMAGQSLEAEVVSDRLLLTYPVS